METLTDRDEKAGRTCGKCGKKASRSGGVVLFDGGPVSDDLLCVLCIQPHLSEHPEWTPTRTDDESKTSELKFDNGKQGIILKWLLGQISAGRKEFAMTSGDKTFEWGPHGRILLWLEEALPTITGILKAR